MSSYGRLLVLAALVALPLPAAGVPLDTMDGVGAKILSCWSPPAGAENSVVSMRFSLKADGSLIGPPRPAYIDVSGSDDVRKKFIAAAAAAIQKCTPVELSADLARGIGGQVFTLDFATSDRQGKPVPAD